MKITNGRAMRAGLVSGALAVTAIGGALAAAPANASVAPRSAVVQAAPRNQTVVPATATKAISWYSSRNGSTAYQGYCEKAARLSWARVTHHPSAIDHWRSSDGAKHTTGTPPKGAFVFWNISAYGHVGIADGSGGFWATSVAGKIGHRSSLHYFRNYLGWKPGNSN
jgi:hypothetical protein